MSRIARYVLPALIVALCVGFSSCGEDEVPKSTIEFNPDQLDDGELLVYESNGGVTSFHPLLYSNATGVEYDIEIDLNRSVAETTVIRFSTSGSATRSTATEVGDYDIETDGELLVIEKGESSATITVRIFEDFDFEITSTSELYEMFTIELEEIVTGSGKLGEKVTFDVYIYEDDNYVQLSWEAQDGAAKTANLDAFLWMDDELDYGSDISSSSGDTYEIITIPAGYPNADFGLSYTYKTGNSDDLDIEVFMFNLGGNLNGDPDEMVFTANYNLTNINDYRTSEIDPHVAQTLNKSVFNYVNVSDITKNPNGGSRMKTGSLSSPRRIASKVPLQRLNKERLIQLKKASGL